MLSVDEYTLENIARDHRIDAGVFIPFVIVRLSVAESATEATLSVRLRDVEEEGERVRTLRLQWLPTSAPMEGSPLQEREMTEFAACGMLAC